MGDVVVEGLMGILSDLILMVTTVAVAQIGWYLAAGVVIGILVVALLYWCMKWMFKGTWWVCAFVFRWIRMKIFKG